MVDYAEIHRMAQNGDVNKRKEAVGQIGTNFQNFSKKDKEQAWKDLLELTKDENIFVKWSATFALGSAFQYMTDKEQATKDLLALTKDRNSDVRRGGVDALGRAFQYITDNDQATKDLLVLTKDVNSDVRRGAAYALGRALQYITDNDQATKDLLELTKDENSDVRRGAAIALCRAFQYMTYKKQAWKDLLALTKDENSNVRRDAVDVLGQAFQYMTDKGQAWKNLLALTKDEDSNMRKGAAFALCRAFQYMTYKKQATKDLLALTKDGDRGVGLIAASALGFAFHHVTDKEQVMKDLLELKKDRDSVVRDFADYALFVALHEEQATKDLLALTRDVDRNVRRGAAAVLGVAFHHITDKEQATKDLLELTKDEHSDVRWRAAIALDTAFKHVAVKEQAWKDLLELTKDEDIDVRWRAAITLDTAFQHVTNKEQATKDLLELTNDDDSDMRKGAASALGFAFQHVTNKEQVMKDLLELTKDEDSGVRISANYSLGKISIYLATEAESEEIIKEEMDKAIGYFEKSSQESTLINQAEFCLPFYRSYNAVIFSKEEAKEDIKRNLEEAKWAVADSECKEKLLEVIENLANALQEAQKLRGLDEIKTDLNAYRRYCDRAVKLLEATENKAPKASKLLRRGLPIIDERIKAILEDIQNNSKALSKYTKDTILEDLGTEININGQNLVHINNPIILDKRMNNLQISISAICAKLPDLELEACELLKKANEIIIIEDRIEVIDEVLMKMLSEITKEHNLEKKIVINQYGPQSKVYLNSKDNSLNITGDFKNDLDILKYLIKRDYKSDNKDGMIQVLDQIKQSCSDPSKKKWIKDKLTWIITKTSEFSSISSFAKEILQNLK